LIALTSTDLHAAVSGGQFREDLFFRLSVLPIVVPPLRERPEDILPAAEHFLASLAALHRKPAMQLSEPAARMLPGHSWPGNFRELRNAIERGIVFSKTDKLEPDDFPDHVRANAGNAAFLAGLRSLEDLEREAIRRTLEATRYHITQSAGILGISRKTLLEKRKKYGLQ
jgi:Response regulator containing CheY-like receiver, AAA-type ATPase, and DNA-binding domains